MKQIVAEDKIDAVVACGGGSAVDTAKATAYYTGKHVVIIPTVAAIIEANVYLSGVGADNVNCVAAHSFYNGLTSLGGHSAPHGYCVAFGTLVQLTLEGATKEEFEDIQGFCLEVGLPVTLEELGITTDEQIRTIAKNACVPGETIHNLAGLRATLTPTCAFRRLRDGSRAAGGSARAGIARPMSLCQPESWANANPSRRAAARQACLDVPIHP